MKKLIVAAPFGNYLRFRWVTPTLGTYTVQNRGGLWKRLWKVLTTVRYSRQEQSWVNKLGLPNPGIHSLRSVPEDCIVSIHGFNVLEWQHLLSVTARFGVPIELNLSCPNIDKEVLCLPKLDNPDNIIAKLPPIGYEEMAEPLLTAGVRHFHLCNTLPCKEGGKSGKPLKAYSLRAVEWFRKQYADKVKIIGGGGVTSLQDAHDYILAGANRVSIATMLMNPANWSRSQRIAEYLEERRADAIGRHP